MSAGRYTLNDAEIAKIIALGMEHLGRLANPEYSKRLREDLLTLPDEIKAQVEKAQATIAQANTLRADIAARETDSLARISAKEKAVALREATLQALDTRKVEVEAIENRNKTKALELIEKQKQPDAITKGHADTETRFRVTQAAMDKRSADLDAREKKLADKAKELVDYEKEINETAEAMSGLAKKKLRK